MVQGFTRYPPRKWFEECWTRICTWLREQLTTKQTHAGKLYGKGGDEAAAKDEDHDRYAKENEGKGQNGRKHSVGRGEL